MNLLHIYYLLLSLVLVAGIGIQLIPQGHSEEHYIGANTTSANGYCITTWMGGWDYDSFFSDIYVNGVNIGHASPYKIVYNGPCRNITITAYNKPLQSEVVVYNYKYL